MEVILHVGAHRTGSTSFQRYMRAFSDDLEASGIGFWGPGRTRNGLFHGLTGTPDTPLRAGQTLRGTGRVQLNLATSARRGIQALVVSDENMLGTPRDNLRSGRLYRGAGERGARFHSAFGGRVTRVVVQIRTLDAYWASLFALGVARGAPLPCRRKLGSIARHPRSWRAVITDLACAYPGAELIVTPFERFAGRPDQLLACMTGQDGLPPSAAGDWWVNRSPDLADLRGILTERGEDPDRLPEAEGRWMPFTETEAADLREAYADDLYWLRAGAEGLATLTEEPDPDRTRITWPPGLLGRGPNHDRQDRRLAGSR